MTAEDQIKSQRKTDGTGFDGQLITPGIVSRAPSLPLCFGKSVPDVGLTSGPFQLYARGHILGITVL